MDDQRKLEGIPFASEMLGDLKQIIRMQKWIIVVQWVLLAIVLGKK